MHNVSKLLLVLGFVSTTAGDIQAGVTSIWAVNDGEKVEKDDLHNPNKSSNSAWDGTTVKLFAARNEVVCFQLIVEADGQGITSLSASLPELGLTLGNSPITYSPPGLDPTLYVDRPIQIFSENYMNVTAPTQADWIVQLGSPSAPKDMTGWKPVQLVPENARVGRGGFPLQVKPSNNQAVWIEIYTGHGRAAGIYQGRVNLTVDGRTYPVPVQLELLNFTLPEHNSLQAMIYYESEQPELYQGHNLDPEYHRFAHRQRIELVNAYDVSSVTNQAGRFTGDDFSVTQGYEGPGENVGNLIIPASFYGPGDQYDDQNQARQNSDQWMSFLNSHFPSALTFLYMPDEPGPSDYGRIWTIAGNIHSNPGPGNHLPIFVTHEYTAALDGAIDIWCSPTNAYQEQVAIQQRKQRRQYWIYNGMRPYSGAVLIDSPATDPRVIPWICFKHGIPVYFYWHSVHWMHNSQKPNNRIQDVWGNPVTFDNRGQIGKPPDYGSFANGDGVLIYPGTEVLHPEEDRGIPGPCASIQLANFRRGLEDHLYLTLAMRLGLKSEVEQALQTVVPRSLSEATETVGFAETGNEYEVARYRLGKAIETHAEELKAQTAAERREILNEDRRVRIRR
jgi:hypothetical protein